MKKIIIRGRIVNTEYLLKKLQNSGPSEDIYIPRGKLMNKDSSNVRKATGRL